jgi:CHAT domain-containing protein
LSSSFRKPPPRADIERQAAPYIKLLSEPPQKGPDLMGAARRLGEILRVGYLSEMTGRGNTLIIIPDGILHFLPFEALAERAADDSNRYLIDRYSISYAPSASVWIMLKALGKNRERPRGILAFGNPDYSGIQARFSDAFQPNAGSADPSSFRIPPLPFSGEEIESIAGFFAPDSRKIYLGSQAGEAQLKAHSRGAYQIIHLACHGLIDEVLPYRSALLLSASGASGEDGILHVWELYNLRLRANLVILSACQTGLGAIEKAEGVLGLTRIFFYTGANSVLSTLWNINDRPTSILMKSFYGHLSRGLSKGSALREAKLEMMRSASSHPYFWAGYIISGEASSGINFRNWGNPRRP